MAKGKEKFSMPGKKLGASSFGFVSKIFAGLAGIFATGLVIFVILLVLMGGINQRKLVEQMFNWSKGVGETFSKNFNADNIDVNKDGVYIRVDTPKE